MEEKRTIEKSELVLPLIENFKQINDINISFMKDAKSNDCLDLKTSETIKNNVSAMCQITNTINNLFVI